MNKIVLKLYKRYLARLVNKRLYKSNIRHMLANLNPGKNLEDITEQYYVSKIERMIKMTIIIFVVFIVIAIYKLENSIVDDNFRILRNTYGGSNYQTDITAYVEEENYPLTVDVKEKVYTDEQINDLYIKFEEELDELYLGTNESSMNITNDLNLVNSINPYPFTIRWETSNYELVYENGILGKEADENGDKAFVTAVVTYEDFEIHKKYDLIIYPKEKTPYEKQTRALVESVMEMQEETKNEDYLQLPLSINNKNIIWKETEKPIFAVLFFISFILLIGSWIGVDNDLAKENKKREQALKLEYSEFVSKLELLISSGMTLRGAFEKIDAEYLQNLSEGNGKMYVYEELHICLKRLRDGASENECYEMFGKRCGVIVYKKLVTLLVQNLKRGTKGLVDSLQNEAAIAFDMRKQLARRMGEEAQTKLLFPMILMLCVVMIIIIIPAYFSFGL